MEFLSDLVDRFPLPDLAGDELPVEHDRSQAVICGPADSSIGEAGDAMAVVETDLNSTCQGVALSAPASEQSTGKDDPEAPGWTRRIRVGRVPDEWPPCAARMSALELTIRSYAEKKKLKL